LKKDPQTGKVNAKSEKEAEAILQAEDQYPEIKNARRPDLKKGEPNIDFKTDKGWVDIKTPEPSTHRTLAQQAQDIADKSKLYDPDVKVLVNLNSIPEAERAGGVLGSQMLLEREDWRAIRLANGDFSGAKLSGSGFANCRFESCNFSNTELLSANLRQCQFLNCQFINADLRGLTAERCDFSDSDFARADLTDTVLRGCLLANCVLDWSWLVRTDLRFANLNGVRMESARLLRTKLYNENRFLFAVPHKITAQEIDVSPDGDGSRLTGKDALERLQLKTA